MSIDKILNELNTDRNNESSVEDSIYDEKIKSLAEKIDTQNRKLDYYIDLLIKREIR